MQSLSCPDQNIPSTAPNIEQNIITDVDPASLLSSESSNVQLTKNGLPRKRKIYTTPTKTRKAAKLKQQTLKLNVKEGCNKLCIKKECSQLSEDQRIMINRTFCELKARERKWFIYNHITTMQPQRRRSNSSVRSVTVKYTLPTAESTELVVCKKMFLTTLGFEHKNDRVVRNVLASKNNSYASGPKHDKRGKHDSHNAFDKTSIQKHIESYHPTISHYRREHAPNVRYLPSDITIKDMHKNYNKKEKKNVSYELYRKIVSENNISFSKLGHEECWSCEKRNNHEKKTEHSKSTPAADCEDCNIWKTHNENSIAAREEYRKDCVQTENDECVIVSADLQKVTIILN